MTIAVQNTLTTNTFDFWRTRTNELAYAMSSNVVTTGGSAAAGDAVITGSFTANVLIANTVRVANSTASLNIAVPTTAQIANGNLFLNANGSFTSVTTSATSNSLTTTVAGSQNLDNYPISSTRGAEYFISVKDTTGVNNFQATSLLTMHSIGAAYSTEYAVLVSNNSIATFSVSTNATHVILSVTPTPACTAINFTRVTF